jgi:hypothetical protein
MRYLCSPTSSLLVGLKELVGDEKSMGIGDGSFKRIGV